MKFLLWLPASQLCSKIGEVQPPAWPEAVCFSTITYFDHLISQPGRKRVKSVCARPTEEWSCNCGLNIRGLVLIYKIYFESPKRSRYSTKFTLSCQSQWSKQRCSIFSQTWISLLIAVLYSYKHEDKLGTFSLALFWSGILYYPLLKYDQYFIRPSLMNKSRIKYGQIKIAHIWMPIAQRKHDDIY